MTEEEAASALYSIDDVVLPLPGCRVQYPRHATAQVSILSFRGTQEHLETYSGDCGPLVGSHLQYNERLVNKIPVHWLVKRSFRPCFGLGGPEFRVAGRPHFCRLGNMLSPCGFRSCCLWQILRIFPASAPLLARQSCCSRAVCACVCACAYRDSPGLVE